MRVRILTLVGAGLVVVVGVMSSTQVGLMGQAAGAQGDTSLKTPWGAPDRQGIWAEEFDTPLERPEGYGNREFYTDEEYAEADNERARLLAAQTSNEGDRRSAPGSQNDVAGAYSNAYLTFKHLGRRTSLIVDPPNGRIPALTPEAQALADMERGWRRALLRSTETCELELPACSGQEYNPTPSPRRSESAPRYNTGRMNRHDDPEDGAFGDRCLLGHIAPSETAFGGNFRRLSGQKAWMSRT